MTATRVLLVDDHHLVREGMASIINAEPDFVVVGEATDGIEALVMARELRPALILMDIAMPGCDGLEATQVITQEMPDAIVIMLTVHDEADELFEAIRNGARGYLLKSIRSRELIALLRGVMKGDAAMTPSLCGKLLDEFRRLSRLSVSVPGDETQALTSREREVLALAARGASDQTIADELVISIHTVKTHMRHILAKLHVSRRHEAAAVALRNGLLPPLD